MINFTNNDTIVALATPPYKCAIHIIRISGNNAYKLVNKIADRKIKRVAYKITYGWIVDPLTQKKIDQVLFMKFTRGHSYTGEDLIEINCHGGLFIAQQIIALLINHGARMATNGEFTKRAFVNNRINFSQAEAVNNLINSDNFFSHQLAINNLQGYSNEIFKKWIHEVYLMMASFELALDYPEYEENELDLLGIVNKLNKLAKEINVELLKATLSQRITGGIKISLVGKTNVGKSSIFNLLINEARSIVTEIHGTTRDVVTERVTFNGYPVIFCDSAGIRKTLDKVEIIGINKSKELIKKSDLVLIILDANSFSDEDKQIISLVQASKVNYAIVVNKIDLNQNFSKFPKNSIHISALNKEANDLFVFLNDQIKQFVNNNNNQALGTFMVERLKRILPRLKHLIKEIKKNKPIDLLAMQFREIHQMLLELTGEKKDFDLIENLFKDFCVGK